MRAIILGAGRGVRRLQSDDSYPLSLIEDSEGKRVLDWIIAAIKSNNIEDISFVAGYHIEKIVSQYSYLRYFYNKNWDTSGSLESLLTAEEMLDDETLIINADVVFHNQFLRSIIEQPGDIVVGNVISPSNKLNYSGVIKLSKEGAKNILDSVKALTKHERSKISLYHLIKHKIKDQDRVCYSTIEGKWAKVDKNLNFSKFFIGSKHQTLERLKPLIQTGIILDQINFTVSKWYSSKEYLISEIKKKFKNQRLIIRSSSHREDGFESSQAGHFESILDIDSSNTNSLTESIEKVIRSFGDAKDVDKDEIFIQPYKTDIAISGVIFTKDIDTGSSYIVINYDESSGLTDTVTSGTGENLSTIFVERSKLNLLPSRFKNLARTITELEIALDFYALDIEFAIDKKDEVFIFQVRPLTMKNALINSDDRDITQELENAVSYIEDLQYSYRSILDEKVILSEMSDWNPAEIIGTRPKPLATSVYKYIITDSSWAKSRKELGYKDLIGVPLMLIIGGRPYINVTASFKSFIPASLDTETTSKILKAYVRRLESNPKLHDKIEFDVLPTCLDFNFGKYEELLNEQKVDSVSINNLRDSLKLLTEEIINQEITSFDECKAAINILNQRRRNIILSLKDNDSVLDLSQALEILMTDCRKYGAIPFSNIARHAFIASSFLKSLLAREIINRDEYELILSTMPTVASEATDMFIKVTSGEVRFEEFLEDFGHLRPGTYDITIPSYKEKPLKYFGDIEKKSINQSQQKKIMQKKDFKSILLPKKSEIEKLIKEIDFNFNYESLIHFIERSIPARERFKLEFTKNIDLAFSLLKKIGKEFLLTDEEISFLPIEQFFMLSHSSSRTTWINKAIRDYNNNKKEFIISSSIRLPGIILESSDVYIFTESDAKPNFITTKQILSSVKEINMNTDLVNLEGCIVLIESADPGFDWIFSHKIAGLITKHGGVASHMAIRCAEFNLPAAIGCGERIYEKSRNANMLDLNCLARKIEFL
jgi:glutamine kinase